MHLPPEQVQEIQRKLASANGACFNCQQVGHTVAECTVDDGDSSSSSLVGCTRCGRETHDAGSCYAKTDIDGKLLREGQSKSKSKPKKQRTPSPVVCRRCGRDTHDESSCYAKTLAPGFSPDTRRGESGKKGRGAGCFRCGRDGHWEGDCYAKTDINGFSLLE